MSTKTDDVATATMILTLKETIALLQSQVGVLEKQVAAAQREIEGLKETPRDPSIVPRLVRRDIFERIGRSKGLSRQEAK